MARIVQQGFISTSGTSFENEPIIKSDGSGEMMQWQPSDGGADGVYIIQDASSGSAELGIGVSPTTPLDVVGDVQFRSTGASNDPAQVALWATDTSIAADDVIGSIIGAGSDNADGDPHTAPVTGAKIDFIADHAWDGNTSNYQSTRIDFFTQNNTGTNTLDLPRMSIGSTGVVTIKRKTDGGSTGANTVLTLGTDDLPVGTDMAVGDGTRLLFKVPAADTNKVGASIDAIRAHATDANSDTSLRFMVSQNDETLDTAMTITSTGAVTTVSTVTVGAFTIPATGGSSGQVLKYPSSGSTLEWGTASTTFGSLEIGHGLGSGGSPDTSNTALGTGALDSSLSTSTNNTAIGASALTAINHADGDRNTAVGSGASVTIASGADTTSVGYNALNVFTGSDATAVGSYAADAAISQTNLTAIGAGALGAATSGNNCTAVGKNALGTTVDGAANTAVGVGALAADCGDDNTAVGQGALDAFTGSDATAVGSGAADAATSAVGLTAVGKDALGACTDGHHNTAVGYEALSANVSADTCTAIGKESQKSNTGGSANTSVGKMALYSCATGANNTAAGHDAGYNTLGGNNVAIGMNSAFYGTTTDNCIAIGYQALLGATGATTGNENLAIGSYSLDAATVAHSCVAVGHLAASAITYQSGVTAIGHSAFGDLTEANPKGVAVGWFAGRYATRSSASTYVGYSSGGGATITGDDNTCVGYETGNSLTSGGNNTLIGSECGNALNTGGYNVAVGENALGSTDGGGNNVAIGRDAIGTADANSNNTAVGNGALRSATTDEAVAVGSYASYKTTSAARSTAIGYGSLYENLTGADNTALGYFALKATTGTENTAVGSNCLDEITTGSYNTALGALAMGNADGGEQHNTAIGWCALFQLDDNSAEKNVALGANAGRYYETTASATPGSATPDGNNASSINSIFIGYDTRSASAGDTNSIVIGHTAVSNGDNTVTLGNDNTGAIHCADTSIAALSDRRIKRDVKDAENVGLAFVEKLNAIEYKKLNPADWPEEIRSHQYRVEEHQELVTPAIKAEPAVWAEAVEEVTKEVVIPAVDAVYEDVVIPAVEEIIGEREAYDEVEVSEEVENVEMVKGEGDEYVRTVTTETITRTERTPLYDEHPVVNEDGTPCLKVVEPAITEEQQVLDENGDGVVNEDGTPLMETVEVKAEVTEQVIHLCPIRESYVVHEAQPERIERKLITPAQPERTETVVVTSAKERRLVKPAVEAADAVYKTVTVPADERPEDNDTNYVGLIAQDVQTAMTDAGVDFDLVTEGANGKLAVKYSNLVIPLLKAVQELSAEVKALKNG